MTKKNKSKVTKVKTNKKLQGMENGRKKEVNCLAKSLNELKKVSDQQRYYFAKLMDIRKQISYITKMQKDIQKHIDRVRER